MGVLNKITVYEDDGDIIFEIGGEGVKQIQETELK